MWCGNIWFVFSCVYIVHGFSNAIYNVLEGERLDTTFRLNVKGETSLPLVLMGIIALEKGTASE